MPVPKDKQKLYGKIAGHLQNLGYTLTEAKARADKAIFEDKPKRKAKSRKKKK